MPPMNESPQSVTASNPPSDGRAIRILAKSVHRELRESGYATRDLLEFANELLGLVTEDVRDRT